jgi:hypothetical protein
MDVHRHRAQHGKTCWQIVEVQMAEDEAKPVRSPTRRPRRKPREVTWEEMTDYQRWLVKAGQTAAVEVSAEMTAEQYAAWTMERLRKA